MSTLPTTLHSLLGGRGPALGKVRAEGKSTKPSKGWLDIDSKYVSHWGDFTLANLRDAFGDILNQAPSSDPIISSFTPTSYSINTVSDVKRMAERHLSTVLRGPIADGAAVLGPRMRRVFPFISIDTDRELASGPAPFRPALSFSFDGLARTWLVLGAARRRATWRSSRLAAPGGPGTVELDSLRQLASYACVGGTPYTFIVTEDEVVVVRFFFVDDEKKQLGAEWSAISWNASGYNVLTANLATWCLVMMALNENHRKVQARAETLPITKWIHQGDPEEAVSYEHCISLRTTGLYGDGASTS